jgi:hypothetical protein
MTKEGYFGTPLLFLEGGWVSLEKIKVIEYRHQIERRLSVVWNKIKAEYIAGGTSYRKLAKKYGVSRTKLERKAKDEKWTDLRRQAEVKAEAKIVNAVSDKSAKIDDKYFRLVDMLFDKAEEVIANTPVWSANALKEMSITMKNLKECKGVKSEADMREQEARIKKLQKEAEKEDDTVNEIEIVFNAGPEEWNE